MTARTVGFSAWLERGGAGGVEVRSGRAFWRDGLKAGVTGARILPSELTDTLRVLGEMAPFLWGYATRFRRTVGACGPRIFVATFVPS